MRRLVAILLGSVLLSCGGRVAATSEPSDGAAPPVAAMPYLHDASRAEQEAFCNAYVDDLFAGQWGAVVPCADGNEAASPKTMDECIDDFIGKSVCRFTAAEGKACIDTLVAMGSACGRLADPPACHAVFLCTIAEDAFP